MTHRKPILLAALLLAATAHAQAPAEPPAGATIAYVVRPGDTLIGIARRGLRTEGDWLEVQRLNSVGDVFRMDVGLPLRIPVRLLRTRPATGRVLSFRGDVSISASGRDLRAAVGRPLGAGTVIRTGPSGTVTLGLSDGSVVTLPTRSELRLERLDEVILTGDLVRSLLLREGRTEAAVPPRGPRQHNLQVRTPVSVAAVRGTIFRVAYSDATGKAATGVLEGAVGVSPGTADTPQAEAGIDEGNGIVAGPQGLDAPSALLPAPTPAGRPALVEGGATLALAPVQGAASYRAVIADDGGFIAIDRELAASAPTFRLGPLPSGFAFVRVSAVTADGLEGKPYDIAFQTPGRTRDAHCASGRCLLLRWAPVAGATSYRVQFSDHPDTPPWGDDRGNRLTEIELDAPARGTFFWRVGAETGKDVQWSRWRRLEVRPMR